MAMVMLGIVIQLLQLRVGCAAWCSSYRLLCTLHLAESWPLGFAYKIAVPYQPSLLASIQTLLSYGPLA